MGSKPPQPPKVDHKVKFYTYQIIGGVIIALIPLLALFGVFGSLQGKEKASSDSLSIEVTYPKRFRYKTIDPFDITVRNNSQDLRSAVILIDKKYLSKFSNVTFTPSPERITDTEYVFDLGVIQPGNTRVISGKVQSERYGRFTGTIRARTSATTVAEITVQTISFP